MKTKSFIILFLILPSVCLADIPPSIDFYTDGTIQDGNDFSVVRAFSNANIDMTGGLIETRLELYDTSIFNAYGGVIEGLYITLFDSATLNLRNLDQMDGNVLTSYNSAKINIYGLGFQYENNWLRGQWASGESFIFYVRDENTYNSISLFEIPEPGTLILLLLGAFGITKGAP